MQAKSLLRKKPTIDKGVVARDIATRYWGVSDSEANDFSVIAGELRALNLDKSQLQALRDWLPTQATGTTGDRIQALDSLLARLEGGG